MIKESYNLNQMRDLNSHTQSKEVASDATSLDDCLHAKNIRFHLTFSRDKDDQSILQSNWTLSTLGHVRTKVVVPGATFP